MPASAAHASAFYDAIAKGDPVWTIRDAEGYPAPKGADGRRAQPFWSTRARAERIVQTVAAYHGFEVVSISSVDFRLKWLPGLARDGLFVGVNWSAPRATGYDVEPQDVERNIAARERPT